jgi:hypothetical protein
MKPNPPNVGLGSKRGARLIKQRRLMPQERTRSRGRGARVAVCVFSSGVSSKA